MVPHRAGNTFDDLALRLSERGHQSDGMGIGHRRLVDRRRIRPRGVAGMVRPPSGHQARAYADGKVRHPVALRKGASAWPV